ncbi:zinc finger CCHC domain-containing protein 9-like [Vanessa cardui]|uniref:zinc finger CCHC domain-containing protein 9-like n=1 Tax=Vanessa cardui TaxID=171605 RepID=UPI001F140527|nr:zinc finger CCHC domain-containing protein 9-like [Vanessa cardui]
MTRFARAKGSKASNLKSPEDSTPWEVMKEHMLKAKTDSEECKKREEAEQQRIENYNNFLKEHKVQKRKATWCDFPESENVSKPKQNINKKKNKEKPVSQPEISDEKSSDKCNDEKNQITKNKNKITPELEHKDENDVSLSSEQNVSKKKQKKNKKKKELSESKSQVSNSSPSITTNIQNNQSETANNMQNIQDKYPKAKNNNAKNNKSASSNTNNQNENSYNSEGSKKVKNKIKNGKAQRRKPIDDKSFQLIINGKEVELVRYDGFPIMKKDAERLDELKKNMIKKGIPKSEVQRTMKLERRRAEKALARVKREVCYNCRKGGHNLSDCPDLKSNIPGVDSAEGVCFKCGSTEHRQFECKVQRDKEFRFATCFICKESGHIARQCPDNPKGLYPNGGCCKLCGDVTHLRKDCPTVNNKKEETSIKLQTLNDDNIEDLGYQEKSVVQETSKKPKKIKF